MSFGVFRVLEIDSNANRAVRERNVAGELHASHLSGWGAFHTVSEVKSRKGLLAFDPPCFIVAG